MLDHKQQLDQIMAALHKVAPFPNGISITVHPTCESFEEATETYCDAAVCFIESNKIHIMLQIFDPAVMAKYNKQNNKNATPLEVIAHELLHLIRGDGDHGLEFETQLFDMVTAVEILMKKS